MTGGSIPEYSEVAWEWHVQDRRKKEGNILAESTSVIGHHGKAAIRLFHRRDRGRVDKGRGRLGAQLG